MNTRIKKKAKIKNYNLKGEESQRERECGQVNERSVSTNVFLHYEFIVSVNVEPLRIHFSQIRK